jgi:hypothetical protein
MAPKRKAQNPLKDGKLVKKCFKMKKEDCTPVNPSEDTVDKKSTGKNDFLNNEQEKDHLSLKKEILSSDLLDENQNTTKTEFPNIELNQLLQKKTKFNYFGTSSWKVYLFPSLLNLDSIPKKNQFFGLDLVEEETERTVWTHKASVWQDLFASVKDLAQKGKVMPISSMFDGILACAVRAVPKGPSVIQTFRSNKGQNIQHWIMLVPMPSDIDLLEYIPKSISNFHSLCGKPFIRSAYKSGVVTITQHPGIMTQILEDGTYWNVLDNVIKKKSSTSPITAYLKFFLTITLKRLYL